MDRPNVFTIPAGVSFLDTLVAALLDGRLVPGFRADDPFALADTTIYLPTRRAARTIREHFLAHHDRPVLLPRIRTLGDIDEDGAGLLDAGPIDLPDAVPAMERQLVLTALVLKWSGALVRAAAGLPDEELLVPSSPADAARLAASLSQLIDQVGTSRPAWAALFKESERPEQSRFWDITLEFLKIATAFWPAHLAERGLIDPGARRDQLIRAEAERLKTSGAPAPVIAAGSTGSVPATADLLAAIAALPNGAVVLPGLDQALDSETWDAIGSDGRDPAGAGHPQFGLKALIERLNVQRDEIVSLAEPSPSLAQRACFVSESMRPARAPIGWSERSATITDDGRAALDRVGLIEAANEREEALAVGILLRGAVETDGKVAALVTPDRGLARRVAVELKRWAIDVDDSAGEPLSRTPPGVLARLTAETALTGAPAEALMALAKHPLAATGLRRDQARRAAGCLERAILRGPRLKPGLAALNRALEERAATRWTDTDDEAGRRTTRAERGLTRAQWAEAKELAANLREALRPLEALAESDDRVPLADLIEAHRTAVEAVAGQGDGGAGGLYDGEAGEALALAFDDIRANAPSGPAILPRDYPGLFTALIERVTVRRRGGLDPRVHIWGALEARLQRADSVVLSGLNEGTWPAQTRLDPLLSRPMREALDLEPPERRIGLAAHDFAQALGHEEVWLTRANRVDGEPRVASRWLRRLTAYAGDTLTNGMCTRGDAILAWARRLDRPVAPDRPQRPRPSPLLDLRPKSLPATRIETLIRDPYAIYAEYVLRLRPFEPLAKLPDARERGTLIHDILEAFVRERPHGPFDAAAAARLIEIGRDAFARYADFPEVAALWWPRFEKVARWFVEIEAGRDDIAERHVEGKGALAIAGGFELSARADRLDRLVDDSLAILDYKTGAPPSMKMVRTLSPQLPLEALIARAGGFEGLPAAAPSQLIYYRLSGRGAGGEHHDRSEVPATRGKPGVSLAEIMAVTEQRLAALVAAFARPDAQYISRRIPERGRTFVGDYDHLARVAEWTTTEEEDDEGPPQP